MGAVRKALNIILKRPFIICFTAIITLIYCVVDYFNPVTQLIMGFNRIGKGDFLESIIYSIQILSNSVLTTRNFFRDAAYFFIILAALSIILGVMLSGFFNILNKAVEGAPKSGRDFFHGIKKYSIRTALVFFRIILIGIMVFVLMLIATVPAVIVTKAWVSGKVELIAVMAFLDVITFGVLIFGLMFYVIYITFWLPSSINYRKGAFFIAKKVADLDFWRIFVFYIVFGLAFLVSHMIITYLNAHLTGTVVVTVILFIVNWLIKTLFFCIFLTYIFWAFKMGQKKLRLEKEAV
jgi:hypothetical protein